MRKVTLLLQRGGMGIDPSAHLICLGYGLCLRFGSLAYYSSSFSLSADSGRQHSIDYTSFMFEIMKAKNVILFLNRSLRSAGLSERLAFTCQKVAYSPLVICQVDLSRPVSILGYFCTVAGRCNSQYG